MNKIRMIALAACMAATLDASAQEQEIRLFSHRGGRMEHDENTLSAFQARLRRRLPRLRPTSA